uniref:Mitochondria-eating protein n=1 Tax=Leptobrachium leishanense TaxID=445787 RepID=A0A8C5M9V8_9ANUR
MAGTLRTLVNSDTCRHLQDKLEEWYKTYHINSHNKNLNVCCELLKMNTKLQGQLLTILNETTQESDHDKSGKSHDIQYPPQWGSSFIHSSSIADDNFFPLQESTVKDLTLQGSISLEEKGILKPEAKNVSTRLEPDSMDQSSYSTSTLKSSTQSNGLLTSRLLPDSSRRNLLVSRFIFLFANHRVDAQNLLKQLVDDTPEMIRRIVFIATVESFHAAKVAFIHLKLHMRQYLKPSYLVPESLEAAVINFITRHMDYYDVQSSVKEVIGVMNLNEQISLSPKVDFTLISSFYREVCHVAFAMQTLEEPLDVAFAVEGELFDENKYHRTYDSDFTAPFIYYHVWPALMENNNVIVKGEAVTRKLALVSKSRSPSLHRRSWPSSKQSNSQWLTTSMLTS